jgi:hypothetical protein
MGSGYGVDCTADQTARLVFLLALGYSGRVYAELAD